MVATYFEKKTYFVTGFAKAVCLMIIIGLANYNYSLCISFVSECTLKLSNRVLNCYTPASLLLEGTQNTTKRNKSTNPAITLGSTIVSFLPDMPGQ